ncbi:hypothetical protein JOC37_002495 [Desulfohalotomaculum tongense]|nr:hypothetical protein [Desulforadius tongensis]
MPQNIKCNVTECQYNSNVMCDAPMVQVNRNNASQSSKSDETKCETFKPRA